MWRTLKPFQPSRIELQRLDQRQRRAERARPSPPGPTITAGRSALANASLTSLGQLAEQLEVVADATRTFMPRSTSGPIANILPPLRGTLRRRVLISGASQRGLEPTSSIASACLDPGDGRVERDRRRGCSCRRRARLPPFEQGRPLPFEQRLRRIHGLGVEQVAGDRRDLVPAFFSRLAKRSSASCQLASRSLPFSRTHGRSSRLRTSASAWCRVLSEIHSSLTVLVDCAAGCASPAAGGRRAGCSSRRRP